MGRLDKAYNEYEKKLYSIPDRQIFAPKIVNELFDDLLRILPNNGKLYKYKALKTFHIDELENKYIWFSSAKQLNDKKDCTFNANSLKEQEKIIKFLCKDDNYRRFVASEAYLVLCRNHSNITIEVIEKCLSGFYGDNPLHWGIYFNAFCSQYQLTNEEKEKLWKSAQLYGYAENEAAIRNSMENFPQQIREVRDSMLVCSLTTSYDKDSMWAYYCGNEGLCIEYDYSKIQSYELKKIFMQTQKVRYGKKKKVNQLDIIKLKMKCTQASIAQADKLINAQLLTKDKSWSTEEEWRIIRNMRGNYIGAQQPADIISAIYLDYSILNKRKTKQIIHIAKQNGWNIFVRYFDELNAEYCYDTIKNIQPRIKQNK